MKDRILYILKVYVFILIGMLVTKPIFMMRYHHLFSKNNFLSFLSVIVHGLPLDMSVAGYLTALPIILVISSVWIRSEVVRKIINLYFYFIALLLGIIFAVDLVLYEYWGFRLDTTPLSYTSKPSLIFASLTWLEIIIDICILIAFIAYWEFIAIKWLRLKSIFPECKRPLVSTLFILLLGGFNFLAIRGGISVATMNTGRVYFSAQNTLNQAAINPAFSFLESATKKENFAKQYRFMPEEQAEKLFSKMVEQPCKDSVPTIFTTQRPNVVIIILESFMSKDLTSLGGIAGAAPNLSQISEEGILFTHAIANSFRTDRGMVAILSGYPAQPATSIMIYTKKNQSLPSIPKTLNQNGYALKYYYGGDIDFTNMRSYLVGQHFENIVSDKDFPLSERLSKWGVPDEYVFNRAIADLSKFAIDHQPFCTVIQTSSSHEPFDVPSHKLKHPYLNAVNYTDSCLGAYIDSLKKSPLWKNTVVIISPDHAFHYPENIDNMSVDRYKIPIIFIGGAIKKAQKIDTIMGQIDIAATFLHQLGLPYKDFNFSKNVLNNCNLHFGFFDAPDFMGMVTSDNQVVYDNTAHKVYYDTGSSKGKNISYAQAYLQMIFNDLAKR